MRIYFNTSALNRPLDGLSSDRVRLEAEAVVSLLAAVESGRVDWVVLRTSSLKSNRTPMENG